MFDRRGENFGSRPRTEKGAGREMHDQTPGGRDIGRDGADPSRIHEEPGERGGPQTRYEVARPFDPRNGAGGNTRVESEQEDSARNSVAATSTSVQPEESDCAWRACPFIAGVADRSG